MIDRNQIIRRADADDVPAPTVERDYVLTHVLAAVSGHDDGARFVFKGGTAMRLRYFEDYRYSADLDFSLVGDLDMFGAIEIVEQALSTCRGALELPELRLNDATPPRIEYVGPLGRSRTIKLDLTDDELVEETVLRSVFQRYEDQPRCRCLVYAMEEVAAEKLRCVIQRLQCRDLYDLHELLVVNGVDPDFVWPLFQRKARHRGVDPDNFATRFERRLPEYRTRWENELAEHVPGEPPQIDQMIRGLRRKLRDHLRRDPPGVDA